MLLARKMLMNMGGIPDPVVNVMGVWVETVAMASYSFTITQEAVNSDEILVGALSTERDSGFTQYPSLTVNGIIATRADFSHLNQQYTGAAGIFYIRGPISQDPKLTFEFPEAPNRFWMRFFKIRNVGFTPLHAGGSGSSGTPITYSYTVPSPERVVIAAYAQGNVYDLTFSTPGMIEESGAIIGSGADTGYLNGYGYGEFGSIAASHVESTSQGSAISVISWG